MTSFMAMGQIDFEQVSNNTINNNLLCAPRTLQLLFHNHSDPLEGYHQKVEYKCPFIRYGEKKGKFSRKNVPDFFDFS